MKKFILVILSILILTGCSSTPEVDNEDTISDQIESTNEITDNIEDESINESYDKTANETAKITIPEDMLSSINDWVLGTEYGIDTVDFDGKIFTVNLSEDKKAQLADYELNDINEGLVNLANAFDFKYCQVVFADGSNVSSVVSEGNNDSQQDTNQNTNQNAINISAQEGTVNLMFIHHSVGESWLNDGLSQMLNYNNIHVADTYYGWSNTGDHTDIVDWPKWFNDDVMPSVYNKLDTETASNTIEPADSENTIIMFKSCFPNSDVGNDIHDEIVVYDSLLYYFIKHTDKMFVLITPPPMQNISHPKKTRELNNYLTDEDGWLKDYPFNNVFVYDLYNVLTHPDNHHMLVNGLEHHIVANSNNTLYYDSSGDDHPSYDGNVKAAKEFVPLLMHWYDIFTK